jgi:thiamine biosynthesis lipoprotein ApbE
MTTGHTTTKLLNRRRLLSFEGVLRSDREQERSVDYWVRVSRFAMACRFEVVVTPEGDQGVRAAQECLDQIDCLESILSVFCPTSETGLLNCEAATHPVCVGSEIFELLQLCERLYYATGGAFDITTGTLSECWGFQDRSPRLSSRLSRTRSQRIF